LNVTPLVLILTSVILAVIGQLTLKGALNRSTATVGAHMQGSLRRIAASPGIWAGLGIYGVGTFFWLVALSQVELGYAYPFLSLSYVLILIASAALFREQLSLWRLGGVLVICLGVYIVASG
jgi:drug/metabolite transporter (DMT)-like permease